MQNPTYEDMTLLSSLLGPVKPPVASQEDVAASAGLHKVSARASNGMLHLVPAAADPSSETEALPQPQTTIILAVGERCLVCLCEYETEEEVRKLGKCGHVFHRECIDKVCTLAFH